LNARDRFGTFVLSLALSAIGLAGSVGRASAQTPGAACAAAGGGFVLLNFDQTTAPYVPEQLIVDVLDDLSATANYPKAQSSLTKCADAAVLKSLTDGHDLQSMVDRLVLMAIRSDGKNLIYDIIPYRLDDPTRPPLMVAGRCAGKPEAGDFERDRQQLRTYWAAAIVLYEIRRMQFDRKPDPCRARAAKLLLEKALADLQWWEAPAARRGTPERELYEHLRRRQAALDPVLLSLPTSGNTCGMATNDKLAEVLRGR
jgi:hypothetical protein